MRRRALLSAVASAATALTAVTAGCTSVPVTDDPATSTSPTTDRQSTESSTVPEPGPEADVAIAGLSVATEKTAPTREWFLRIEGVYSTDAVDRHFDVPEVVDVADIEDDDVRETVEHVLDEGKVWTDEIPSGLREFVESADLVTWDADTDAGDLATHWSLAVYDAHPDREPVLDFDVEVLESGIGADDPAELAFSVRNTSEVEQSLFGGVVAPFGIPRVHRAGQPDDPSFLLWHDYESIDGVSVTEERVVRNSIGTMTPVAPGETLTRTYTLDPSKPQCDAIGPGDWAYEDALEYGPSGEAQGPGATVEYRLEFTIEDV